MKSTELRQDAASQQPSHTFDIFLSYSRKDKDFAAKLEEALESYKYPKSLKRAKRDLNVFRDESDIQASEDYRRTIQRHLSGSAKMVVVCSPDARKSKYVADEIKWFLQTHVDQDIIPVLIRGKANNDTTDDSEMAFPEIMCENRMPLAANFLGCDTHKGKLHKGPFRSSFYSLVAAMSGTDRRTLEQIDEKARARRRALTLSVVTAISVILSVALVFTVISQRKAVAATAEATRSAKAEETAKNDALASAAAEKIAKDQALASEAAEKIAKDQAVAAAKAETKAKDEAVAAARAETKAKNEAIAQRNAAEHLLYVSNMSLAQRANNERDMTRVYDLLNPHVPKSKSENSKQDDLRSFYWYYLWHNSYAELATFKQPVGGIFSVVFPSDGNALVALPTPENTVELWDAVTQQKFATLRGNANLIISMRLSPDGKMLATINRDRIIRLWDIGGGELASFTPQPDPNSQPENVWALAFSPDSKILASATFDNVVTLWDISARRELTTLRGHTRPISDVAFSPDGKFFASGSFDQTLKFWDTTTWKEVAEINDPPVDEDFTTDLSTVAFSPDAKLLATSSGGRTVKLRDASTRKELAALKGNTQVVTSLVFSPDSKTLASVSTAETILWDTDTRQELVRLKDATAQAGPMRAVFSPNGKTIAVNGDRAASIWDISSRHEVTTLERQTDGIDSVAFSPDGKTIASGSSNLMLKLWDAGSGRELAILRGKSDNSALPYNPVLALAFSLDGKTLAAGSGDGIVRLWDTTAHREVARLTSHTQQIRSVVFSPDGRKLASAGFDNSVKIWDSRTWKELTTFRDQAVSGIYSVAFSPDGETLASANDNGIIKLWNLKTGRQSGTLESPNVIPLCRCKVNSVAFSPDGRLLASAGANKIVYLWDVRTRSEPVALKGHADEVSAIAFSPDGKTLISGSRDKTVKLWDVSTRAELATLTGNSSYISSVAFSPDGSRIASASDDHTVRLWNAATREEVARVYPTSQKSQKNSFIKMRTNAAK